MASLDLAFVRWEDEDPDIDHATDSNSGDENDTLVQPPTPTAATARSPFLYKCPECLKLYRSVSGFRSHAS